MLSQGLLQIGNKQEIKDRFELLTDVHENLQQRFIAKLLEQLSEKDKLELTPLIEKMETLKKHISEHIKTAEARDLHQYTFCLKEAAMLALKLCKKYKVGIDIKSFSYNAKTRMIELNGEDLYFLGDTKHQQNAAALMQDKLRCTQCDSDNVVMVSELHHAEPINPKYAPPRKKLAIFGVFLTCSFLGLAGYLTNASVNGSGETPYLYLFAGLACLAYTAYAFHYNAMKFPSAEKVWESSYSCQECDTISSAKS